MNLMRRMASFGANLTMMLPDELVLECLIRLPGKELGRCKCVCKSWRSIIGSPSFLKAYRNREPILLLMCLPERIRTGIMGRQHVLFRYYSSTLWKPEQKKNTENFKFSHLSDVRTGHSRRGGSITKMVNGLVCLRVCDEPNDGLTIYSVGTGERMSLPCPAQYPGEPISTYHLGYDQTSCRYKLLRLIHPFSHSVTGFLRPIDQPLQAEIITLRPSGSLSTWRKLDHVEFSPLFITGNPSLVAGDGFIWWFSRLGLVTFDLNREKFDKVVQLPQVVLDVIQNHGYVFTKSMGRPAILSFLKDADTFSCCVLLVFEDEKSNKWSKYHVRLPRELGDVEYRIVDAGNLLTGDILFTNVHEKYPDS
ncbi:OLC1v1006067C1 [Oldenlandia corymbosa var. corymbosa]|uniref:OLC1v1006067C1 n=1 Tax=Oldenlandia corymbosa var. corymbosa TaxID=529605 RepID=A0AAV1DG57_OLDCO|nr:OLC1v1006067C1 [Oldenlandia corymbosa var. corymbosa]